MLLQAQADGPLVILVGSLVILIAASAVCWTVWRRMTTHRRWLALAEWAQVNRLSLHGAKSARVPEALADHLASPRAQVSLRDETTTLAQIETAAAPGSGQADHRTRWNLLIRRTRIDWPSTALRPAAHRTSVIDFFRLSSFPSLIATERFVIFGADTAAALAMAASELRALTPADVGLLLHGQFLILDFSTRPFDPIDLGRMVGLAEQLVAHLPTPRLA